MSNQVGAANVEDGLAAFSGKGGGGGGEVIEVYSMAAC